MSKSEHNFEAILEQASWVQRLAYRLCTDAAQADDVTQESLLSAFREPHRRGSALRHWLVGVVRNQARMARRSNRRRHAHEAAVPAPPATPSPEALFERVATQRRVVQAVMELPEIYRSALLRRYFDDLSPGQIAAIDGTPEATIKTRLRRGLDMLRERLGHDLGTDSNSRSLLALLVPVAEVELRRRAARTGAAAKATSWTAGSSTSWLLCGSLAAAGLLLWLGLRSTGSQNPQAANAPSSTVAASSGRATNEATLPAGREPVWLVPTSASLAAPAAVQAQHSLQVRVDISDLDDNPVAGLAIEASDFDGRPLGPELRTRTLGTSDSSGTCKFELEPKLCQLIARSPIWTTAVPGTVFPYSREAEVRVVVARRRTVTGVVSDAAGIAIAGARITYRSSASLDSQLRHAIDRASRRTWTTTCDPRGCFTLDGVPELPDACLRVAAWDYETGAADVPYRGDAHVACRLVELSNATSWLQGSLLLDDGSPAEGAVVTLGTYAVRSDAQGRFRIQANPEADADCLWASTRGFAPLSYERPTSGWPAANAQSPTTGGLTLQFQEPLLAIGGRVVDRSGQGRAGVEVDILQATALAFLPTNEVGSYRATPLEELCLGEATRVRTGPDGRFELRGLAKRDYRLVLRSKDQLAIRITDAFAAGTSGLELAMPHAGSGIEVAGTVTDARGRAMQGVPVYLRQTTSRDGHTAAVRTHCITSPDGRFAFPSAMPRTATIHVSAGGSYTAISAPLTSFTLPTSLQLVLRTAGSFYLQQNLTAAQAKPTARAHSFYLESAHGERVQLQRVEGQACFTIASGSIEAARSPVYHAPCGSHVLVLLRDGVEQQRLTIDVRAGPTIGIDI